MPGLLKRRDFLRGAGSALGTSVGCLALGRHAFAASDEAIAPPVIDRLRVRVVMDTGHDLFISGDPHPMVGIERVRVLVNPTHMTLGGEWGLSLHLESTRASEARRYMLDFGYTPEVLTRNFELLDIDPALIDGLILSHGHLDHYGGLVGFLGKYRERMRPELKLFAGGETNFCYSYVKAPGTDQPVPFSVLDRRALAAAKVETVLCETPHVVADAFTSGHIGRTSFERVLPNTLVEAGAHDGAGCRADHFTEAERQGRIVADQHWDEHATCFVVRDRGLVVITSCGHAGLINTLETAMRVSGIKKLHAVIGGFHLAPAPKDYVAQAVGELKTFDPDVVIPMHCSGANFIEAMRRDMPDKLVLSTGGSRFTFGA
jgi:7,8-dihydropterin-6-yl-methyl-4-(beta-D-ribofuranosyl)aminobenzene 5'-phosphate synthase